MQKHLGDILIAPRITEKASYMTAQGAYVFNVAMGANKIDIARAVRELYKVTPRMVRIVAVPRKAVMTRGTNRRGMTVAGKKAYVFLKKGETIEIV